MEKYFKIEIRLAKDVREIRPEVFQLVDLFYYGDGAIKIVDDKILWIYCS